MVGEHMERRGKNRAVGVNARVTLAHHHVRNRVEARSESEAGESLWAMKKSWREVSG